MGLWPSRRDQGLTGREREPQELHMAGFDYDRSDIHLCYDESRGLPPETEGLWMEALSEHVPRCTAETIIDLGCGTGRFTRCLADHFSAQVVGIEPSWRMLTMAKTVISSPSIASVHGRAESLPLADGQVDMVFLSMVYHHIRDKDRGIGEIARVMRRAGSLCVRTATLESVDSYLWVQYFPRARQIEAARMPSSEGLVETLRASGFELKGHNVVQQFFAKNLHEYLEKISLRGISSLRMLTEEEFQAGLGDFREYCHGNDTGRAVYEDIDLFIFSVL
jgi:ubiquinone/menaquinone biosynthesis C-methylase UbiE